MSILDRIDDTLDDWHGSSDAMRWTPEAEQEPDRPGLVDLGVLRAVDRFTAAMNRLTSQAGESPEGIEAIGRALGNLGSNLPNISFGFAPAGTDPRDDAAFTSLDDTLMVGFTADASQFMAAMARAQEAAEAMMARAAQANRDARLAQERRYAWSGPTRFERKIALGFGLTIDQLFPKTLSALDARYHRRYRNRMGRR